MKRLILVCLFFKYFMQVALAAALPTASQVDTRVQSLVYHPDQVYEITTAFGVATTIAFEANEEVTGVSLGDPSVWQVVPVSNTLNIKPVGLNPDTNLTVWTNKRLYLFNLTSHAPVIDDQQVQKSMTDDLVYLLKFIYPDQSALGSIHRYPGQTNTFIPTCRSERYSVYGDKAISPLYVCDDGQFTYLQFSEHQERPAVFLVDEQGYETAVNTRQQDSFHVITRLGAQFTLRHGEQTASLFNEAPPEFYL